VGQKKPHMTGGRWGGEEGYLFHETPRMLDLSFEIWLQLVLLINAGACINRIDLVKNRLICISNWLSSA
jgi:hypothetical protein